MNLDDKKSKRRTNKRVTNCVYDLLHDDLPYRCSPSVFYYGFLSQVSCTQAPLGATGSQFMRCHFSTYGAFTFSIKKKLKRQSVIVDPSDVPPVAGNQTHGYEKSPETQGVPFKAATLRSMEDLRKAKGGATGEAECPEPVRESPRPKKPTKPVCKFSLAPTS